MEDLSRLNNKIDDEKLTLVEKVDEQKIKNEEMNNSRYTLSSKSKEDSFIKNKQNNNNMDLTENVSYKEKQLSILYEAFESSYSKKLYKDLIKDIEEKEDLLSQNSLMSFEIKIIKIKALLKLLLEEYNNFLQTKHKTFHDLDTMIYKIKNEFNLTAMMLINDESYVNEQTTQIYCKFLYLLSKISLKREDYLKSLGYVTLGINMLKVFFIKKKVASDINTYKIYCKLLLELINLLIGDQNYEQALYYIRLLFKITEIALKYIYYYNNKNKKKLPIATIKKFITFGGIGYIYTGCCLEQLDDPIQAFEAYKEALLFFKKGSRLGISFQTMNSITINNSCSFLAEEAFEKLKIKFEKDKIERLNIQKKLELQKKKEEYEMLQNEKLMKLKYIANGLGHDPFKFEKLENKLNKNLFPSSVLNDLERTDDELTSLVSTYYNKNKKSGISSYNEKMSSNIKNNLGRYELYNILMSKKFREFILRTKQLQFYNPKTGSKSISIIQRHLNNKIQIESYSKKMSTTLGQSFKVVNNTTASSKTERRINTNENFITNTTYSNNQKEKAKIKEKILFKKRKKIQFRNNNLKLVFSQDKLQTNKNSLKLTDPSIIFNTTKNKTKTKFKYKLKRDYDELQNDFERKNLDKNLMTKNYLRKYSYYDKLADKELKFQKKILYFKYNNTLYNNKRTIEENNGILGKDDLAKISLIINEESRVKPFNEEKIEINLIKDSFGPKQNQISLKMKSAMSSVISKYINERKSKQGKQKLLDPSKIKTINEKKILSLIDSITDITNNMSRIKHLVEKTKNEIIKNSKSSKKE